MTTALPTLSVHCSPGGWKLLGRFSSVGKDPTAALLGGQPPSGRLEFTMRPSEPIAVHPPLVVGERRLFRWRFPHSVSSFEVSGTVAEVGPGRLVVDQ